MSLREPALEGIADAGKILKILLQSVPNTCTGHCSSELDCGSFCLESFRSPSHDRGYCTTAAKPEGGPGLAPTEEFDS